MGKTREYIWYIHSKDIHTNAVIAQAFEPSTSCAFQVLCDDKLERNMWITDHALISYLKESKRKKEVLDFEIWVKVGAAKPKRWHGFPDDEFGRELQALVAKAKALNAQASQAA